jgi:hypothetical protein
MPATLSSDRSPNRRPSRASSPNIVDRQAATDDGAVPTSPPALLSADAAGPRYQGFKPRLAFARGCSARPWPGSPVRIAATHSEMPLMTATVFAPLRPVQLTLDLRAPKARRSRTDDRRPYWQAVDLADLGGELRAHRPGVRTLIAAYQSDDGRWVGIHDLVLDRAGRPSRRPPGRTLSRAPPTEWPSTARRSSVVAAPIRRQRTRRPGKSFGGCRNSICCSQGCDRREGRSSGPV